MMKQRTHSVLLPPPPLTEQINYGMTQVTTIADIMSEQENNDASSIKNSVGYCHNNSSGSGPVWSMSSLQAVLPDSPSPICSSPSITDTQDCSRVSTEFFTPRKQQSALTSSSSSNEKYDFLAHNGKNHCHFIQQSELKEKQNQETEEWECPSFSTVYESTQTTVDHSRQHSAPRTHSIITLPTMTIAGSSNEVVNLSPSYPESDDQKSEITVEEPFQMIRGMAVENEERYTRMARRPYGEFLAELKMQRHCAQVDAWRKAKHVHLQNKLRRKETAINKWQLKQRNKAKEEMEKIEEKLRWKRARALKKMEHKINRAKDEANKRKSRERQSTLEKMLKVTRVSDKIQASRSKIWLKLIRLC